MDKIKIGDMVDYHSVVGGEITSKHHIVTSIMEATSTFRHDLASITGKSGSVRIQMLTPSEWDELWLEDKGLCDKALSMIVAEDLKQRGIWGEQIHHSHRWLTILTEEVGELGKAILEENPIDIEKEAVQVATLALKIAWMAKAVREKS